MPDRHGPMRTGRFVVELAGTELAGFRTVDLPTRSIELIEGPEGRRRWGGTSFDDLEMERGVKPGATELHDWFADVRAGKADAARKEISVKLLDEEGTARLEWTFSNAWPKQYEPPQLDATATADVAEDGDAAGADDADGDVATESVTVVFDEMIRTEA